MGEQGNKRNTHFSARSGARPAMRRVAVNARGLRIGTSHPGCKVPDWAIELILELHDQGLGYRRIAAKFDDPEGDGFTVSWSYVRKVCKGTLRAQIAAGMRTVR